MSKYSIYIGEITKRAIDENHIIIVDGVAKRFAFFVNKHKGDVWVNEVLCLFTHEERNTLVEMLEASEKDTVLLAGQFLHERWVHYYF